MIFAKVSEHVFANRVRYNRGNWPAPSVVVTERGRKTSRRQNDNDDDDEDDSEMTESLLHTFMLSLLSLLR